MTDYNTKTIRDIAAESPASVRVFEEFKIDYCCGGRKNFGEACREAGVDPAVLGGKLDMALAGETDISSAPEKMNILNLVNHIIDKHHTFTRTEIERLSALMDKVVSRHGQNHPELVELSMLFKELCIDLLPHLQKEEEMLFPYFFRLHTADKIGGVAPFGPFGPVENPIRVMMTEHEAAGEILAKMRSVSGDYQAPADACPSFLGLYFGLDAFEKDLHQHIHLESNVLFPMAVETVQKLSTV